MRRIGFQIGTRKGFVSLISVRSLIARREFPGLTGLRNVFFLKSSRYVGERGVSFRFLNGWSINTVSTHVRFFPSSVTCRSEDARWAIHLGNPGYTYFSWSDNRRSFSSTSIAWVSATYLLNCKSSGGSAQIETNGQI